MTKTKEDDDNEDRRTLVSFSKNLDPNNFLGYFLCEAADIFRKKKGEEPKYFKYSTELLEVIIQHLESNNYQNMVDVGRTNCVMNALRNLENIPKQIDLNTLKGLDFKRSAFPKNEEHYCRIMWCDCCYSIVYGACFCSSIWTPDNNNEIYSTKSGHDICQKCHAELHDHTKLHGTPTFIQRFLSIFTS